MKDVEVEVVATEWELNDQDGTTIGVVQRKTLDPASKFTAVVYNGWETKKKPVIAENVECETLNEAAAVITNWHYPKPKIVVR